MADPAGISGIRATGLRPLAILKKDNYRAWSTKLKVQLKVMDCWLLVTHNYCRPQLHQPGVIQQQLQQPFYLENHGTREGMAHLQPSSLQSRTRSFTQSTGLTKIPRRFGRGRVKSLSAVPRQRPRPLSCFSLTLHILNRRQLTK